MIRPAKFADIPSLKALLRHGYERSRYKGMGRIDALECNRLLTHAVQRDGQMGEGGTLVRVAEADGRVAGFIVGALQRVYLIGDALEAIDLFWYAPAPCPVQDRLGLFSTYVSWAEANPRVVEIRASSNDALGGEWEAIGLIYQKHGLRLCGASFVRTIERD